MNTVSIRYLGARLPKVVDLPVGLSALSERTGEVVCNPVGEFPADQAQRLLAIPGAAGLYMIESEYQARERRSEVRGQSVGAVHESPGAEAKKQAQRERGRQLAAANKAKKAANAKKAKEEASGASAGEGTPPADGAALQ